MAICTVGVHYKAKFEFAAHRAIGIAAGLEPESLDRLAAGKDPEWSGDLELAHRYAATLLEKSRVSTELHQEVVACFGDRARTSAVIAAIQESGACWCGGTVWRDRPAMRISISPWATTEGDIERSLEAILAAHRTI